VITIHQYTLLSSAIGDLLKILARRVGRRRPKRRVSDKRGMKGAQGLEDQHGEPGKSTCVKVRAGLESKISRWRAQRGCIRREGGGPLCRFPSSVIILPDDPISSKTGKQYGNGREVGRKPKSCALDKR
jgi:hypothetical protein